MLKAQPGPLADGHTEAVTWRDGVHLEGTGIWCDTQRTQSVCFVSAADAITSTRHRQLIGTAETLTLLAGDGPEPAGSRLSVPYGRPFTLGTTRIELIRSGHGIGGASLAIDLGDARPAHLPQRRVLFSGAVDPRGEGLGGRADLRPCDALVVDATYGVPRFAFPPVDEAVASLMTHIAGASVTIALVGSPAKGLDVACRLVEAGIELHAHRLIHRAAQLLRPAIPLPPLRRWTGKPAPGQVILWPAVSRDGIDRIDWPEGTQRVLISGLAQDPRAVSELGADAAVPWSDRADHAALREYITASGAQVVYLTGRHASELAAELVAQGRAARVLAPPEQMSLF